MKHNRMFFLLAGLRRSDLDLSSDKSVESRRVGMAAEAVAQVTGEQAVC